MIGRYISHIPAKHFKMVRYYGFLSNRKRGELLLKVYEALEMEGRKKPEQPGFATLIKEILRTEPYKCILCGNQLRKLAGTRRRDSGLFRIGISNIPEAVFKPKELMLIWSLCIFHFF